MSQVPAGTVMAAAYEGNTSEADKAGLSYWVGRLKKGESRKVILESFAGCQEFKDIVKGFGL